MVNTRVKDDTHTHTHTHTHTLLTPAMPLQPWFYTRNMQVIHIHPLDCSICQIRKKTASQIPRRNGMHGKSEHPAKYHTRRASAGHRMTHDILALHIHTHYRPRTHHTLKYALHKMLSRLKHVLLSCFRSMISSRCLFIFLRFCFSRLRCACNTNSKAYTLWKK
jgi:hypothetical protein